MATIRTTLQMQDQMTGVIRNMSAALGASINAFEQLSSASNNAVSTASIESARRSLGALNVDIAHIESNLTQATAEQHNFNAAASDGEGAVRGMVAGVLALVGAYASLQGLKDAMNLADETASNTARIGMMNDGLQTTEQLQRGIFEAAQRSLSPYSDMVALVGALGNRAGDAFSSSAETVKFAETLGKMFSIAGSSQQEMASASLQLTQALGAGALRGEELNAVLEAAPNVIQAIADEMGVGRGQIKDLAKDGLITADVVKNALLNASDEVDKKFASMPTTFSDAFTVFRNNALVVFEDVLKKMTDISNSKGFAGFLSGLAQSLTTLAVIAGHTIDVLASVGGFVADNWWIIGPIVGTATAAIVAFGSAMLLMQTYTLAVAAATWVLNSALWASPITWVAASVIALVGIIYLVVGALNKFAGTSISATGIVAGAFAALGAYLYNVFATLWNLFASIAEFFVNVWRNPIYSVKKLFVDIAKVALDMAQSMVGSFDGAATNLANLFVSGANGAIKAINAVIGALNRIPGVEIGSVGEIAAKTSVTADMSKFRNKMDNWLGEKPKEYKEFDRMEIKSIPDAAANAYKAVVRKNEEEDNRNSNLEDLLERMNDLTKDGNKDGKDTAKSAKKAADKAGIAADDLKYMRDLSEREAINRYTTASINMNVKNDLNVNNEMDIDGLIDRFGEKLEEAVETVAVGGGVI